MFPLRDSRPSQRTPIVMWALIITNALVFLYELSLDDRALQVFFYHWGLVPKAFSSPEWGWINGLPEQTWVNFLSNMFLHGGWMHFLSNMWFLYIFADNVEDHMGHLRFLCFYILCGLGASWMHLLFNADSPVPALGASGAISGVLGAYWRLFPTSRIITLIPVFFYPLIVEVYAVVFIGFWFLIQLMQGFGSLAIAQSAGVAWWAHVGGFIFGLLLYRAFLLPSYRNDRDWPI